MFKIEFGLCSWMCVKIEIENDVWRGNDEDGDDDENSIEYVGKGKWIKCEVKNIGKLFQVDLAIKP